MQTVNERAVTLLRGSILHKLSVDLKSRSGEVAEANGLATLEKAERKHIVAVLEQAKWAFFEPNGAIARLGLDSALFCKAERRYFV
jgi:transcriptional regulator with GAF, ATPase, and Fis domain